MTRFEFPEEAKSLTMPTEEGVGLEDEGRLFSVLDAAGEEDEPEAVGWRNGGLSDLAVQDDQLLAEESIFGDEVRFTAREVGGGAENNGIAGGLGEVQGGLFKE